MSKRFKDLDKERFSFAPRMSHNQYSVKNKTRHYMWGHPALVETLLDRVLAGAAFIGLLAVIILAG